MVMVCTPVLAIGAVGVGLGVLDVSASDGAALARGRAGRKRSVVGQAVKSAASRSASAAALPPNPVAAFGMSIRPVTS